MSKPNLILAFEALQKDPIEYTYAWPAFTGEITGGLTQADDDASVDMMQRWLAAGAQGQAYRRFSTLALCMPAPCVEIWPMRVYDGKLQLLVTRRDPAEDPLYGGMCHGIGSAKMFVQGFGENEDYGYMFPAVKERALKNPVSWHMSNVDERVMLRVLTRELGFTAEACVALIQKRAVRAGDIDQNTPRGLEQANLYYLLLSDAEVAAISKPVEWIDVASVPAREDFIHHQKARLLIMLKKMARRKATRHLVLGN